MEPTLEEMGAPLLIRTPGAPVSKGLPAHASILALLLIAFSIELYLFAKIQDVWVDESTQLSGITLSPLEMLRWLAGQDLDRFGVPGDRMPPVSYLLDSSWLRLFGSSEFGFRIFHSAFVVGGVLTIAAIALRQMGITAAGAALAFLILSPKLIRTGVEIRAYPIFFSITCIQLAVFLKLLPKPEVVLPAFKLDLKLLAGFATLCLAAIYTHFYGVVSTCAFFVALLCAFARSPRSLAQLGLALALVAIASSGLIPFVTSAVDMSPLAGVKEKASDQYFTFFLRLFAESANMVLPLAAAAFIGGTVALLLAGGIPAFARIFCREARPYDWLYIVVIAGICAPVLASAAIKRFDVMNPNYSSWLFAPLALLVGAGASSSTGFRFWDRGGRFVAISAMLAGAAVSTFFFLAHSSMFIHGPQRFVGTIFDGTDEPKAVIYENGAAWGFSYFPLVFSHKNRIIQYRTPDDSGRLVIAGTGAVDQSTLQAIDLAVAPYNHLLVVDVRLRTYRDIRACQKPGELCPTFPRTGTAEALIQTGSWREVRVERDFGLYDTQVILLDRPAESVRPAATRR